MSVTKKSNTPRLERIKPESLRLRRNHTTPTGISPFLLEKFVTDQESLEPWRINFIKKVLEKNDVARVEYERMLEASR